MKGWAMGWLIAWLVIAIFLGTGVTGVNFPILYGFFVSTIIVGLFWILYRFFSGIIDSFFGRRE